MTVLLGPCPCARCGAPVLVARRRIAFVCANHRTVCHSESLRPSTVEADGTTHMCPADAIETEQESVAA